jgi:hypothetical protein
VLCRSPLRRGGGCSRRSHAYLPDVPLLALCTSPEALDGQVGVAAVVGTPFAVEWCAGCRPLVVLERQNHQ